MLNEKGATLIEIMIAFVITLFVMLAMMQTALLSIDTNMTNTVRDEAVSIAEQRMRELRNMPFTDSSLNDTGGSYVEESGISRSLRNANVTFTPSRRVDDLNTDNKQVDVTVAWTWKGQAYNQSISTIMRRQ